MVINGVNSMISGGEGHLKRVNLKGFSGFTLAEVLITLVIIGVIAAMTIPTLINKTNNHELVSRLKKTYSTLAQATNRIIAEEGNPRGDIGGWATSTEAIHSLYKKYIVNSRDCGFGSPTCLSSTYKTLNGGTVTDLDSGRYTISMPDGATLFFWSTQFYNDCSGSNYGSSNICQSMVVDINGGKGPNFIGKDTFEFFLTPDGIVPAGCNSNNSCRVGVDNGYNCTCKVIREGAINY